MNKEEEIIFENEYIINKKITTEVCKTLLRKLTIIGLVLGIFNIIMYILSLFYLKESNNFILIIGIGCLVSAIISPYINSKRTIDYYRILNNGKIEKTIIKFEDKIKVYRGTNYSEYEYSQVISKVETKI